MHPGKMMAWLNAKPASFDAGSGGIPDLTPQDIAAALGMVPDGLGRELLCRVWWPAGAERTERQLAKYLEDRQRAEWMRREKAMLQAMEAVATHTGGDSFRRAQSRYAAAHRNRWPKWITDAEMGTLSEGYLRVRVGVLTELSQPGLCHTCGGRGHVTPDVGAVRACTDCRGTGRKRVTDAWRAGVLRITEGGYRSTWRPVYEWTLQLCADALATAERQMRDAVG